MRIYTRKTAGSTHVYVSPIQSKIVSPKAYLLYGYNKLKFLLRNIHDE